MTYPHMSSPCHYTYLSRDRDLRPVVTRQLIQVGRGVQTVKLRHRDRLRCSDRVIVTLHV